MTSRQPWRQFGLARFGWVHGIGVIGLMSLGWATDSLAGTDGPVADKSGYHLFNPTPRSLMRPMSADRPDATESPVTVDAGHVQVEMSFFDYTHDDEDGVKVDAWTVFDTNVKIGLLNQVDLQLVFGAYNEEEIDPDGQSSQTRNGVGDLQLRLKVNLWGNDPKEATKTAFGIMPFVKIPTGTEVSNDKAEGGFIMMLGWDVAESWGLGFQVEIDFVYDEVDDDYDVALLHTVVLGFEVVDPLGAFVEYIGVASSDTDSDYQAILSAGLTYTFTEDVVFDVGTQIGLSDAADDVNLFTGVTVRY